MIGVLDLFACVKFQLIFGVADVLLIMTAVYFINYNNFDCEKLKIFRTIFSKFTHSKGLATDSQESMKNRKY